MLAFLLSPLAVMLYTAAYFMYQESKDQLTENLVKNYLKILGMNALCALYPFLTLSLMFGFPAVMLSAIVITSTFREKLS